VLHRLLCLVDQAYGRQTMVGDKRHP